MLASERPVTQILSYKFLQFLVMLSFVSVSAPRAEAQDSAGSQPGAPAGRVPRERSGEPHGRLIRFETREGSWISLDVSPDGRSIVFDLLGDLYLLPITGGRARPLTAGTAWDGQPRFSPDGQQVAYISDRSGIGNLWVVDRRTGQQRRVSNVPRNTMQNPISSPAWAADGRSIIVIQRRGTVDAIPIFSPAGAHAFRWLLAAYEVEDGRMRWVSDTSLRASREVMGPVVASDARTVYAAVDPGQSDLVARDWRIERISLSDGTGVPELPTWQGRLGWRPALSPDGRQLAYLSPDGAGVGLRLRDLRTFRERWLVRERLDWGSWANRGTDGGTADLAPGYAFTPDGRALVIAFGGRIHRIDLASGRSANIPFVVEVKRELAPMALHQFTLPDTATRTRAVEQPALSPDGRQVAFSAQARIWVMDLPAGGGPPGQPRRLTADSVGEFYPSWSPDGRWIAYSTWQDGVGGTLRRAWVADRVRSPEQLTADTALYLNTVVARDGRRVLAARADLPPDRFLVRWAWDRPSISLVSAPLSTGRVSVVARLTHETNFLKTLTDGLGTRRQEMSRWPIDQLYLTADTSRVLVGLAAFRADGSDWTDILVLADSFSALPSFSDISGVVSPDGRRALVTHGFVLSEVLLPSASARTRDTFDLEEAQSRPFGSPSGSARRWGRAYNPWISWSADGHRVLFAQGGTLFVGDVPSDGWTAFTRVDVPLSVPVDVPHGALVLRGARVITMAGEAQRTARTPAIIDQADLVVQDNRIAAIGRVGSVPIPRSARVVDVSGKTILPGYVDIHDHPQMPAGTRPQQWWGWLVRLAHGVTTVRDPAEMPAIYNATFAYREQERAGQLIAPRIFSTGVAHTGDNQYLDSPDEARAVVQPLADYFGSETFKEYSTTISREGRRQIAAAAAAAGLNATAHAPHLKSMVDGLTGVEHNLQYALYDDVLTFVARSGVTLTNTFGTTATADETEVTTGTEPWACPLMRRFASPSTRGHFSTTAWLVTLKVFGHSEPAYVRPLVKNAAGIVARGGRIGIGSHGNVPGVGFHYEMWYHALGGMPPYHILRAATIDGARAIGHANDFGSLEAGKLADLQILDRNPLEDIKNSTSIRYVMKNGRLYQAADLTEIWPRHKPLDPIYLFPDSAGTAAPQ